MSSSSAYFLDEAAEGCGELDQDALQRLEGNVKIAVESFKENPGKSFDELMNSEGMYSTQHEFGKCFAKYIEIEKIIADDPASLREEEVQFYQKVWPLFDPIEKYVKEREEFLEFQKRYPGSQKATTSSFVEQNDFNFEELANLSAGLANSEEKSPLILFDSIIIDVKNKTLQTLNPNDKKTSDEFFRTIDHTQINDVTFPGRMEEAIFNSSIAIEMSLGGNQDFENNEAKQACESYLTALALNEVEQKLMYNEKRAQNEDAERAEVAAVSTFGFVIDDQNDKAPKTAKTQPSYHLDFDIHNLSYDISFLPSDDSETYKPLEIVSYIGLTGNHQKT